MDTKLVIEKIIECVNSQLAASDINEKIDENSFLIGNDSLLDSMGLVELCIFLEDMAFEADFEFDWTSDDAMSKSRSMFRSPKTLAEEFSNQFKQ